jgi:hypothetical protein
MWMILDVDEKWTIWMWMIGHGWAIFCERRLAFKEIFRMIKSCELEVCSMATDFWVDHAKKDPKYWMHMIKGNHSISKYIKV